MLSWLRLKDLAIIDELELELGPGLNVLTGETGAGKSILVSALELVLGAQGRAELVRSGAKQAEVEALFEVTDDAELRARLRACGIEVEPIEVEPVESRDSQPRSSQPRSSQPRDSQSSTESMLPAPSVGARAELAVRRIISESGRSRAFVNGRLVSRAELTALTRGLLDISSQHEHHTLSNPATHLSFLDAYAGLAELRLRVRAAYFALREANQELSRFEGHLQDRGEHEERLRAQLEELRDASLCLGEDTGLELEGNRLRHSESLLALSKDAVDLLYEGDGSVVDTLSRARKHLGRAAALDPSLSPLEDRLEGVQRELEECALSLSRHAATITCDPAALTRVEERLHQLGRIKRRYGGTLQAALERLGSLEAELDALANHAGTLEGLRAKHSGALERATQAAAALSKRRRNAAGRLGTAISRELASLGMGEARVLVEVSPLCGSPEEVAVQGAQLGPEGADRAEFLIAPNPGEEARPLHRVASGGELSRAMLAIKCVLADVGPSGLYAFDEVDSGVGGGMAEIIGRKIQGVAAHRQVLCITHLPQIAVFADHHFKVEKAQRGGRTCSSVRKLDRAARREEIARMLGGLQVTAKTRAAAKEMLSVAAKEVLSVARTKAGSVRSALPLEAPPPQRAASR